MRLFELFERDTSDELQLAVDDLLSIMLSKDIKQMKTEKFLSLLAKRGFNISTEELIAVADKSTLSSMVDPENISTADELPMDQSVDTPADIGGMADQQAMSDIKSEL